MSLDFLDNLEINRIQVMGEKFAFVWRCFLVAVYVMVSNSSQCKPKAQNN